MSVSGDIPTTKDLRYSQMVNTLKDLSTTSGKSSNDEHPELNHGEPLEGGVPQLINNSQSSSEDESDEPESDCSSDDEPIKAPIELLSEFLQYVRAANWEDASKLCKMILIYEPQNPEALMFGPLIQEKMQVEAELANEEDTDSESSSEDESVSDESENEDGEESDKECSESEEDDRTQHLPNKLVFSHLFKDTSVWKP